MKRLLLCMCLLAIAASSAPWDGTRGTVTISSQSDGHHTVIAVRSSDPSVTLLSVALVSSPNGQTPWTFTTRTVPNLEPSPIDPTRVALAVFDVPGSEVIRVEVTELRAIQTTVFSRRFGAELIGVDLAIVNVAGLMAGVCEREDPYFCS